VGYNDEEDPVQPAEQPVPQDQDVRRLDVVGVRVELPSNQPLVMLKEADGNRYLPIWIGATEALAIAAVQQGLVTARPLTHDLFRDVLAALDVPVTRVVITTMSEGVYYATLVLGELEVSARPSDAIALALRTGSPVFGSAALLDEVAFEVAEDGEAQETEVERFREFLDTVTPEDFGG
jgi:bifunctional DNase/RNase